MQMRNVGFLDNEWDFFQFGKTDKMFEKMWGV